MFRYLFAVVWVLVGWWALINSGPDLGQSPLRAPASMAVGVSSQLEIEPITPQTATLVPMASVH